MTQKRSIKPYWTLKNSELFLGNSIEVMRYLPEKSIDMIFADPPYNLSNNGTSVHAGKRVSVNKGIWDKSQGVERDFNFHFEWISECRRVLKEDGTIWVSGTYHSIYACGYALQLQGFRLLNDISWYKPNAAPNLGCRMFTASHETLIWASKNRKSRHIFNYKEMREGLFPNDSMKNPGKQMRSVWSITTPGKAEKTHGKHPTQKPLLLLDRIIRASTKVDDLILDPFCGSGTTGVASILNGRRFIGIDAEEDYLKKFSIPRLEDADNQHNSRLI